MCVCVCVCGERDTHTHSRKSATRDFCFLSTNCFLFFQPHIGFFLHILLRAMNMSETNMSTIVSGVQSDGLLWRDSIFGSVSEVAVGQRLGISYIRSQQEELTIRVGKSLISINQSSMGLTAISGVVWDAALFLIDYLCSEASCRDALGGKYLDLGCGTGVVGIAACVLGADEVVFSDAFEESSLLQDNIDKLPESLKSRTRFIRHKWDDSLPLALTLEWDTIICSDLFYDEHALPHLLKTIQELRFGRIIIGYKKRHDSPERYFFECLSAFVDLKQISSDSVLLMNSSIAAVSSDLYLLVGTPKSV